MISTNFNNLQIIWTPGKKVFPEVLRKSIYLEDINGHKEFPNDIRLLNQNRQCVQHHIDCNSSLDDANDDFYPIVCIHLDDTKALHLKNDINDLICTLFDLKSPKALLIASGSSQEYQSTNKS